MTVPGDRSAVSAVDRKAADALFTELYQQHASRLRGYIWQNLDLSQAQLAEDLTHETFIEVWRLHILTGRWSQVQKPFGFLRLLARSKIGQHFQSKRSRERALDFGDPVNTPLLATGHSYALERPDAVDLVRDLDNAMTTMTAASKAWRDAHKESYRLRSLLEDGYNASRGGITESAKRELRERLVAADAQEEDLLAAFREACRSVGQARADVESVAGVAWSSPTGLPVEPESTKIRPGILRNDRSVTRCPDGHQMDLVNTHFEADGARSCRACANQRYRARQFGEAMPTPQADPNTAKYEAARAMLADPACATRSLRSIAAEVGVSQATMRGRIPDLADLRRAAKAKYAELVATR